MDWSDKIPFYEALKAKGKIKAADLKPEINDGFVLLMQIFSELSTSRQMGMSVGPIPANILWDAQKRYGLTDAALDMLRSLDLQFVNHNASHT